MTSSEKTKKVDWCSCHEIIPLQTKGIDEKTKEVEWCGPIPRIAASEFNITLGNMYGCLMDLHPVTHRGDDPFLICPEDMVRSANMIMHPGPSATIRVPSGSDMDKYLDFPGRMAFYAHFCPICPYTTLFFEGNVNAMIYGSPAGFPGKGATLCCVRGTGSWIFYLMA